MESMVNGVLILIQTFFMDYISSYQNQGKYGLSFRTGERGGRRHLVGGFASVPNDYLDY